MPNGPRIVPGIVSRFQQRIETLLFLLSCAEEMHSSRSEVSSHQHPSAVGSALLHGGEFIVVHFLCAWGPTLVYMTPLIIISLII